MKSYDDVKITETHSFTRTDGTGYSWTTDSVSLEKLTDKRIKDVTVCPTTGYGDVTLAFYSILFEDGSSISLQGAHDLVYMDGSQGEFPTLKTKQLASLYNESNELTSDDEDYLFPGEYDDE